MNKRASKYPKSVTPLGERQTDALLDQAQRDRGVQELRRAIDESQLVLHYQPKVNSRDGRIVGIEALLRWQHPMRGMIQPGAFIPLLEESGLVIEVGSWVLKQAATDFHVWTEKGLAPPRIAVNVSPKQLKHANFIRELERTLRVGEAGFAGIDIEITEDVIVDDLEDCVRKLKRDS